LRGYVEFRREDHADEGAAIGQEQIGVEYKPLSKLVRAPRNPKDHDVGRLHGSMDEFGFTVPVLEDANTGRLVAGHGRLDTLQQRKAQGKPPPRRVVERGGEWLIPVLTGVAFESPEQAEAYLVADNRLTELGGWVEDGLAAVLSDAAANDTLYATGFDSDDVDALLARIGSREGVPPSEFREYGEDIETKHECPRCGYEWS
jgi:ParB-like chromosome segregation protein Spo0J